MTAHPAAALFPLIEGAELQELADDIRENGLRHPIVRINGLVLDGRNRLRACELAGVAPEFVEWDGRGSPTAFVISENLKRRHLSTSQKAFIANAARPLFEEEARKNIRLSAERTNASLGRRHETVTPISEEPSVPAETARRAAKLAGVGVTSVYDAARVERHAPEMVPDILAGAMSLGTAVREINGKRRERVFIKDKHKELVKRADSLAYLSGKWTREMTDALTPPQARKQLTVLNKAAALLAEVIEAVEYRADTLHTFQR